MALPTAGISWTDITTDTQQSQQSGGRSAPTPKPCWEQRSGRKAVGFKPCKTLLPAGALEGQPVPQPSHLNPMPAGSSKRQCHEVLYPHISSSCWGVSSRQTTCVHGTVPVTASLAPQLPQTAPDAGVLPVLATRRPPTDPPAGRYACVKPRDNHNTRRSSSSKLTKSYRLPNRRVPEVAK